MHAALSNYNFTRRDRSLGIHGEVVFIQRIPLKSSDLMFSKTRTSKFCGFIEDRADFREAIRVLLQLPSITHQVQTTMIWRNIYPGV